MKHDYELRAISVFQCTVQTVQIQRLDGGLCYATVLCYGVVFGGKRPVPVVRIFNSNSNHQQGLPT